MKARFGCRALTLATPVAALFFTLLLVQPGAAAITFEAVPTEGEAPLTVKFIDQSGPDPMDFSWDFESDGVIDSTEQNPSHTYNYPGAYTVRLTARYIGYSSINSTDAIPGMHEQTIVVRQLPAPRSITIPTNSTISPTTIPSIATPTPSRTPVADFSFSPQNGTAPLQVEFKDRSYVPDGSLLGPVRWIWKFGDLTPTAEGRSVTHRFTTPGNYRTQLTVVFKGPTSLLADTRDTLLNVTAEHTVTVEAARIEIDAVGDIRGGDTLELTGSTNLEPGKDLLVEVFPGSYRPADTAQQAGGISGATGMTRVVAGDGTANTFRFTVDTSEFRPDTYTATVQAVEADATATTTFALVERGTETPMTNTTTSTTTPTTSPTTLTTTHTTSPTTLTATPTTYLTTLTATTTSVETLPPGSAPAAAFTWAPAATNGLRIQFTDTSTGAVMARRWEFGDGNVSFDTNPFHIYPDPGTYTVRLAVEGPGGVSSADRAIAIGGATMPPATPTVTRTTVPPTATVTTVVPTVTGGDGQEGFPWWLAAIAAVGLLAGGAALVKHGPGLSPPEKTVPGLTVEPRGRLQRPLTGREIGIQIEVRGGIRRER